MWLRPSQNKKPCEFMDRETDNAVATGPPSKQHFVVLDALRGIAAISVAIFHAGIIFGSEQLLPRANLAVDFFFLLSGVVVAHAYEARLRAGRVRDYFERRAIRLYPMILMGALLGASVIITSPAAQELSTGALSLLFVSASLCLPILKAQVYPGNNTIAPVNLPSWSLFFEIAANAAYGLVAKRLTDGRLLAIVVALFAIELIGALKFQGINFGHRVVDFPWGFARVGFPFFAGVLINRRFSYRAVPQFAAAPALLALVLLLTFCISTTGAANVIATLLAVGAVYPAVIVYAMWQIPSAGHKVILERLGSISYPLYILHVPLFMWLARIQRAVTPRFYVPPLGWVFFGVFLASICAWVVYKIYDVPVRAALTTLRAPSAPARDMRPALNETLKLEDRPRGELTRGLGQRRDSASGATAGSR
ncbi:MAG TPA: acyltransferase [Steroidobacteraceae bacterium]|nr:acyltransferase [Steroidobacteraceae bacterium]